MKLRLVLQALRIQDWWSYLLPPILGQGYVVCSIIGQNQAAGPGPEVLWANGTACLRLLLSAVAMAAFGFLLNTWTDRQEDQRSGRQNPLAHMASSAMPFLLFGLALASALPWIVLNAASTVRAAGLSVVALQALLLFLYHVPPFRWKNRPWLGLLLDAGYSGVLFLVLPWWMWDIGPARIWMLVLLWGYLRGLRAYWMHLIKDQAADAHSGRKTLAHLLGAVAQRKGLRWLILMEMLVLLGWIIVLPVSSLSRCFLVLGCLLPSLWMWARRPQKKAEDGASSTVFWLEASMRVNDLHEVWLPWSACLVLWGSGSGPWPLVVHAVLFSRPLQKLWQGLRRRQEAKSRIPPQ